jgi:hypothetical protein
MTFCGVILIDIMSLVHFRCSSCNFFFLFILPVGLLKFDAFCYVL